MASDTSETSPRRPQDNRRDGRASLVQNAPAKKVVGTRPALETATAAVRNAMFSVCVFSFVINLLGLTGSIFMLQVYDRVLASRNIETLVFLTAIAAFLYLIAAALDVVRVQFMARVGMKFDSALHAATFNAVQQATLKSPSPAHVQGLRDLDKVRDFLSGPSFLALLDVPWLPIYITGAFLLHPYYGLLVLVSAVIAGILAVLNDQASREPQERASEASMAAGNRATATFRNAEVLQAMGMLERMREVWSKHHLAVIGWQIRSIDRGGLWTTCAKFNRSFMQTLVLALGAYLAINREITPGMMIAGTILTSRCIQPIEMVIGQWRSVSAARIALRRLKLLLQAMPERPARLSLSAPEGHLVAEGLAVGAPGRPLPILRNVAFQAEPGRVLAIIGPSAAGKSSLARTLVGVWPALAGAVRLDGSDLLHWEPSERGAHVGYVPQDVELFSGTVAENIARFLDAEDHEILAAAEMAGCHAMVQRLSEGYNTQIGDGGSALSGGQRQRIALARAVFRMPALIVLDEPTASLDDEGEHDFLGALERLKAANRTVIVITHKTSTIVKCDDVLVLQNGTVLAFGPREKVLKPAPQPRVVAGL